VATLSWAGVPLAAGLSATLLFRVLSFWLPMLPGFWLSRDALRAGAANHHETVTPDYWSQPLDELYASLKSGPNGLASDAAAARQPSVRRKYRPNLARQVGASLLRQLSSPLVLILLIGALVALIVHDWLDALIVLAIVIASALVGSLHEVRSNRAIARLREQVASRADVWRDGRLQSLAADEVVPGDIVELSAGSLIPADGRLVEARYCFVNQALLTGETFPVQKQASRIAGDAALAQRDNCLFRGTSLRSGSARLLAVRCGLHTELGHIERSLVLRPPETEFERGLRQFGGLLLRVMLVMVTAVLGLNLFLDRPPLDTLMFAIALAVGLSPELLPAILSATLSAGARRMAGRGVIVRHLNAIENLGAMDTLCTDKTGTLTRGVVALDGALDIDGQPSTTVLRMAWLNASLQTGLRNPLDEAIGDYARDNAPAMSGADKLDEIPYDFVRKRLSVLLRDAGEPTPRLICKGALDNVLQVSAFVQQGDAVLPLTAERREALASRFAAWSAAGYRVLGLAWRSMEGERCTVDDEQALIFAGFLLFFDPPEPGVREELAALREPGVAVKIISGDNRLIARQVAESVGIDVERVITGAEIGQMRDEALINLAPRVSLFAEVDPNQKERIIRALQKTGHVVGFLGDGINDAPALHAADVGISVDNAVDVAKEAADFVLLRHELGLVRQGIDEGRRTFANTLKYIYLTTSANFGNMISMAVASFFLPFLPLLAKQILLNNFLSDIPAIGIAGDRVDADWSRTPHRWDIGEVLHDPVRPDQLGLRSAHLRRAAVPGGRATGAVSQRLVRRIADHRTRHHLRGAHAQAVLPQPAGALPAGQFTAHRAADRAAALHAGGRLVRPAAAASHGARGGSADHAALCGLFGMDQAALLRPARRIPSALSKSAAGAPRKGVAHRAAADRTITVHIPRVSSSTRPRTPRSCAYRRMEARLLLSAQSTTTGSRA